MKTNFSPLSDPESLAKAAPARVTYFEGLPRNYRFNAKAGTLNYEDQEKITAPGSAFSLVPLAFRLFRAALFGNDLRDWAEIYFLNRSGQLCVVSFHSSSVDRLRRCMSRDLLYEELNLTECFLTVSPLPRNHAKHGPYYVADFRVDPLPEPARAKNKEIRAALAPIYRADTASSEHPQSLAEGYGYPSLKDATELTPEVPTSEAA